MEPSNRDFRLQIIDCGFSRTLWHWNDKNLLSPFWRFYWNEGAGASMTVAGQTAAISPSRVYLIPPLTLLSKTSSDAIGHLNIHFTAGPTLDAVRRRFVSCPLDTRLRPMVREMVRMMDAGKAAQIECDIRAYALVAAVLSRLPQEWYAHSPGDARTNAVCRHIEAHCATPITIDALAALARMSRRGLHQLFVRQIGVTPFAYVIRTRVRKAAELLHATDHTIEQIAAETGFCDRNHLTRLFARHMGRGPARYRKDVGR